MTRIIDIIFIASAMAFLLWLIATDHAPGSATAALPFFLM